MKRALISQIESFVGRATGRQYPINWELLDEASLREVVRLMRDVDDDKRNAIVRARATPRLAPRLAPARG